MSSPQDTDVLTDFPGPGLLEAGCLLGCTTSFLPLLLLLAAAFALGAVWGRGAVTTPPRRLRVVHVSSSAQTPQRDKGGDVEGRVWTLEVAAPDADKATAAAAATTPRVRPEKPAPGRRTGRSRDRKSAAPSPPSPFVFRGNPSIPPAEQLFARRASRSEVRDASAPPVCGERGGGGPGWVFGPANTRAARL